MKNSHNLRDLQAKKKEQEDADWVIPKPCMVCGKTGLKGAYGNREEGWTCSAACEKLQAAKPKYPGHSEEDFFKRQKES